MMSACIRTAATVLVCLNVLGVFHKRTDASLSHVIYIESAGKTTIR